MPRVHTKIVEVEVEFDLIDMINQMDQEEAEETYALLMRRSNGWVWTELYELLAIGRSEEALELCRRECQDRNGRIL